MTFGAEFLWNVLLTLVVGPIVWALAYINRVKQEVTNQYWKTGGSGFFGAN
jgi:hypothetical protein